MRDKEVKKWRSEVELFLKKYENIADIKYTYDNEKAQYFEQGKLVVEILWSDVLTMNTNDKWIYVYMKNPRQNIWIPRVTADEEELKLFEQTIEHRLQDAANNMNKS
jgi:F0F1-type ATP synthase alpha subunit